MRCIVKVLLFIWRLCIINIWYILSETMENTGFREISRLLADWSKGDVVALEQLMPLFIIRF